MQGEGVPILNKLLYQYEITKANDKSESITIQELNIMPQCQQKVARGEVSQHKENKFN